MIFNYEEMRKKYGSDYQINKAIKNKEIYKIEKGVYSNQEFNNYLLVINKKYPKAIFTLDSAYYYHKLTDVIPKKYYLATDRDGTKIKNKKINQIFVSKEYLEIGISNIVVNGVEINIYDKERMLIELIKNRKQMPFDYYKEIINNYRDIIEQIDMEKLEQYLTLYKNEIKIFEVIQREVF